MCGLEAPGNDGVSRACAHVRYDRDLTRDAPARSGWAGVSSCGAQRYLEGGLKQEHLVHVSETYLLPSSTQFQSVDRAKEPKCAQSVSGHFVSSS